MSVYENFDEQKQFACRVIADHARTTAFAIADGILPGNEGRSYVLRKIMRRAIYHGREHLGFNDSFFYKVCDFVVDQMKDAYPELEMQRDFIGKMVRLEEERFGATMTVGLQKLDELFSKISEEQKAAIITDTNRGKEALFQGFELFQSDDVREKLLAQLPESGEASELKRKLDESLPMIKQTFEMLLADGKEIKNAFQEANSVSTEFFKELAKLYDTFGTPRDLIRLKWEENFYILGKSGRKFYIPIPEEEFNKKFDEALKEIQKQSGVGKTERKSVVNPIYHELLEKVGANQFHGYELTHFENAKVVALVKDDRQIEELNEGEEGLIVLNETPFYAESGGQVGDTGFLTNETSRIKVQDTFAPVAGIVLHKSKVEKGSIKIGDELTATVDTEKRDATRRNHTATHLLHAALREVLGTHVKQAGSVVAPNFLRFDFSHYQSLSGEEIREIEMLVNREILKNDAVNTDIKSIEEAMQSGATALFGEKYGSQVRVLSIGEGTFSKELCGGTHVRATGDIGSFKILSDEAIASGVRRIRAITGLDAFARFREDEQLIEKSLGALRTQRDNLPGAIEKLQEELKRTRRENDDLKMKIATGAIGASSSDGDEARDISGVKVVAKTVEGLDKSGMRHLSDTLLAKLKSGVVILARTEEDKVSFIVRVSDDLTNKIKAGKIVQEIAPVVGGRGGGKADMAEGGGTDATKLGDALQASYNVVEQMLA